MMKNEEFVPKFRTRLYSKGKRGGYSTFYNRFIWMSLVISVVAMIIMNAVINGLQHISQYQLFRPLLVGAIFLKNILFLFLLFVALMLVARFIHNCIRHGGVANYIHVINIETTVKQALLNSTISSTDKVRESPMECLRVPDALVYLSADKQGQSPAYNIYIDKTPGTNIDNLMDLITSCLKGRFRNYECVEIIATPSHNISIIENTADSKRWIVDDWHQLEQEKYHVRLQNEDTAVIDVRKNQGLTICGASGSGKSAFLRTLILQLMLQRDFIDLYLIDTKDELTVFSFIGDGKVVTTCEGAMALLEKLSGIMKERQVQIAQAKLTAGNGTEFDDNNVHATDLGMKQIVIVFEELTATVDGFQSKEKKAFYTVLHELVSKGRSSGIYMIFAMQNNNAVDFPNSIRTQMATKVLLGTASSEVQTFSFGAKIYDGAIPKYTGYYLTDGMTAPKRLWSTDIITADLDKPSVYRQIWSYANKN